MSLINTSNNINSSNKYSYLFIIVGLLIFCIFVILALNLFNTQSNLQMVSGTEYISREQGQVIIKLQNSDKVPIDGANCTVSILYPDKSYFVVDKEMTSTTVPGNYYYSFITSKVEGVYEEHISCKLDNSEILYISSSFHVSKALNEVINISDYQKQEIDKLDYLINKINDVDTNISKIAIDLKSTNINLNNLNKDSNSLKANISEVNSNLSDFKENIQEIDDKVYAINNNLVSLNNNLENIDDQIDSKINSNFDNISNKFKDTAKSMYSIFE